MATQSENEPMSIAFPLRGVDVSNPFDLQPAGTTVVGVNVRAFDPATMRARGGNRPGLKRFMPPLPTGDVIQFLDFIVDPQEDALTADVRADLNPLLTYVDDPSTNNLKIRNQIGRASCRERVYTSAAAV